MTPIESDEELTRKQRREQARADRRALEEAEAAGASRRRRLQLLGGVIAIVVVAIVVVLAATSGSKKPGLAKGSEKTKVAKEVSALVGGIPESAIVLGKPKAPVTLQYFGDLECPICKEFTLGALPFLINKWVRAGDLRIEYHSLETATREPETFKKQQEAALAAGAQNKMWPFIETFYHEQGEEETGYVTESYLDGLAKQVPGLNLTQWQEARSNKKYASEVEEDAQAANNQGFTGTPSFLIGPSGGSTQKLEYTSLTEPTSFDQAIEKLLKS
jgi:protein-disulfide isomerase